MVPTLHPGPPQAPRARTPAQTRHSWGPIPAFFGPELASGPVCNDPVTVTVTGLHVPSPLCHTYVLLETRERTKPGVNMQATNSAADALVLLILGCYFIRTMFKGD